MLGSVSAVIPLAGPGSAQAESVRSVGPSAGAYVTRAHPGTTPRNTRRMVIDADPVKRGYLRYDVPAVPGRIVRATLRVRPLAGSAVGFDVRYQAGPAWTEGRITYRTAPRPGHRIASSGPFGAGKWVAVDVTRAVQGPPTPRTVNFVLTTRSSAAIPLAGRGAGPRSVPQLEVESVTGAPAPLAGPHALLAPGPEAPDPSDPPAIAGRPWEGQVLAATPGTWFGRQPMTLTYQWRRCDAGGESCVDIADATESTYRVTSADIDATLRVVVTASNDAGSRTSTSAASEVIVPAPKPPTAGVEPSISGTAQEGALLTAKPGTWTGTEPITLAHQWRRCDSGGGGCAEIAGATAATYALTSSDVGSTIRVAVTATNLAGSSTAVSKQTKVITALPPVGAEGILWHMDELSGSTMVDSSGGNKGTLKNITLGKPGLLGTAYGFNGHSSVVTVASSSRLNATSSSFTMSAYVSFTSPPSASVGDYDLIRKGRSDTTGGDYKMEILQSGKAYCYFRGSSGSASIQDGPNLADGAWHKVQCIKTSSSISLVVDDDHYTESATVGSISNSDRLAIGAKAEGGDWYLGLMDEVSIIS